MIAAMRGVAFLQIWLSIFVAGAYLLLATRTQDVVPSAVVLVVTALSGFGVLRLAANAHGRAERAAFWIPLIGGAAALALICVVIIWGDAIFPTGNSVSEAIASFNAFMRTATVLGWTAMLGMIGGWALWLVLWLLWRRQPRV